MLVNTMAIERENTNTAANCRNHDILTMAKTVAILLISNGMNDMISLCRKIPHSNGRITSQAD